MKWKAYDYTAEWGNDGSVVYRPLIQVDVSYKGKSTSIMALVDSGTDSALFNADIAKLLEIDLGLCPKAKIGGVGEKIGFRCDVNLTVRDFKVTMDLPVVFTDELPFGGLLGQRNFFARFHIKFEKNKNEFLLALT